MSRPWNEICSSLLLVLRVEASNAAGLAATARHLIRYAHFTRMFYYDV